MRDGQKDTPETETEVSRRTLSQDLNRHAAVVLEGRTLGKKLFHLRLNCSDDFTRDIALGNYLFREPLYGFLLQMWN